MMVNVSTYAFPSATKKLFSKNEYGSWVKTCPSATIKLLSTRFNPASSLLLKRHKTLKSNYPLQLPNQLSAPPNEREKGVGGLVGSVVEKKSKEKGGKEVHQKITGGKRSNYQSDFMFLFGNCVFASAVFV